MDIRVSQINRCAYCLDIHTRDKPHAAHEGDPVTVTVRDNPTESRFEVLDDDQVAGFAQYRINGQRISFTHTETDPTFSGRGLARTLVEHALAEVRERGLAVLPFCPYVRKQIAEHPDRYLDLVPADERGRFDLPS